jgi:hypothetical protein
MLLGVAQRRWAPAVLGAAVAAGAVVAMFALGLQAGPARILSTLPFDVSLEARRRAWSATVALWRAFPLTGTGLGTFRDAFTLVQPADFGTTWWHAHSGPIELLATTGPAGVLLVGAGLAALVLRLLAVLRRGRRSEDQAAGLAVLGALAAVGVHEWFDFGLTIPANAVTLSVLAGAAAAARLAAVDWTESGQGAAANNRTAPGTTEPPARASSSIRCRPAAIGVCTTRGVPAVTGNVPAIRSSRRTSTAAPRGGAPSIASSKPEAPVAASISSRRQPPWKSQAPPGHWRAAIRASSRAAAASAAASAAARAAAALASQ